MAQPDYLAQLDPVLSWIDSHREEALADLQRFCRQPSIAAQDLGMEEMATIVTDSLQALGAETRKIATAGYPIIVGHLPGHNQRRLLIYNHYDVQPPEPLEAWSSPPFAAVVRDGCLYARGVADNKGTLVSRLWAVRAWQAVHGVLPFNLTFLVEGEEEVGSTHLGAFAADHQEIVKADACLWENGHRAADGALSLNAGAKGILYVELRTRGTAYDLHSSNAPIAPNAAWRLVEALSTLRAPSGRVLIEHFYDDVLPPNESERALLARFPVDVAERWKSWNVAGSPGDPVAMTERLLFDPTCTICGIWSGYSGPGSKTVLPATAGVKIDFRLVPDQDPSKILTLLRQHLHERGFDDVEVIELEDSERPSQSPTDTPLMEALIRSARLVYGQEPRVLPRTPGTGPMEQLCQRYGVRVASGAGVGYENSRIHSPNENIRLEDFFLGIKHIAALLAEFSS
jgi:acetylornithine deacetylase/succinyl-diaminopimelate desuccinylase-like protein